MTPCRTVAAGIDLDAPAAILPRRKKPATMGGWMQALSNYEAGRRRINAILFRRIYATCACPTPRVALSRPGNLPTFVLAMVQSRQAAGTLQAGHWNDRPEFSPKWLMLSAM